MFSDVQRLVCDDGGRAFVLRCSRALQPRHAAFVRLGGYPLHRVPFAPHCPVSAHPVRFDLSAWFRLCASGSAIIDSLCTGAWGWSLLADSGNEGERQGGGSNPPRMSLYIFCVIAIRPARARFMLF